MHIIKYKKEIILIVSFVFFLNIPGYCGSVDKLSGNQLVDETELLQKMESRFKEVRASFAGLKREDKDAQTWNGNGVGVTEDKDVEDGSIKVFNEIRGLKIIRKLYKFDIYLYSVIAEQATLVDVLEQLASAATVEISFSKLESAILRNKVDIFLKNTPLQDVLEIVTGIYGLEFVLDEGFDLRITIPSNMGFESPEDYFKHKIVNNFRKIQIKYPDHEYVPESYFKLGVFFDSIGQKIKAVQEFMVVAERYPEHLLAKGALKRIAQNFNDLGALKKSRDMYNEFVDRYPNDESLEYVYWEITNTWYEEEKYDVAIGLYKKIIEMYPATALKPRALERMATSLMKIGKFPEAFDILVKLRGKGDMLDGDVEKDFMVGECLYQMGRPADAFVVFAGVVDKKDLKEDMLSKAVLRQAESLYKMDKCVEAIQAYKKWIQVSGEKVMGMLSIGKCLRQLNLFVQAVKILENAMLSNTEDAYSEQIRFELAMSYYGSGQYVKAIKLFADISMDEDGPQFVDSSFYGAESLFVRKEYKDAIPYYERLVTLLDMDVDRLKHVGKRLAACYQNIGLYSKALDIYKIDATANN